MQRFTAWCRSHPWITGLAAFICLGVGLHFFLNWRSEHAWQRYKAEGLARGVKFSLVDFARPGIPDAENFAKLPMLNAVFTRTGKNPFQIPPNSGGLAPQLGSALKGQRIDWTRWQTVFQNAGFLDKVTNDPVRDTLRALEHYEPAFKEWSEWRTRPYCRFGLALDKNLAMPIPHTSAFLDAARLFSLRLRAQLALGESDAAYADFQEGMQAYRMLREEPTLIMWIVRRSALLNMTNAVGDGLQGRVWTPENLAKIEADLAAIRLWDDYHLALSSERAGMNDVIETLIPASPTARAQFIGMTGVGPGVSPLAAAPFQFIPRRVFRDNQMRTNRFIDELLARVDLQSGSIDLNRVAPSSPRQMRGVVEAYYLTIARMATEHYETMERGYLMTVIQLDEARLAVALERFRQSRGAFPNSLEELAPEFMPQLPVDPYSCAAYRYQRVAPNTFRLYSVGLDRIDGGGILDLGKGLTQQADDVWPFAPESATP